MEEVSNSANIILTVKSEAENDEAGHTAIMDIAEGKTLDYLDIVLKDDSDNDLGNANSKDLQIIVPYAVSGKNGLTVYRYHEAITVMSTAAVVPGVGDATKATAFDELTAKPAGAYADGTFFVDKENDLIYIYASKFSTYAIGYTTSTGTSTVFYYDSKVADTENGTATISSNRNTAITNVIITATPDEGYEVADVVVCDANGKEVAVTKKADGTYSYQQPTSVATVTVTFAVLGTVDHDSFVDVDADDWFYDAVLWAVENGITSGASDTTFSPSAGCTRAQAVTFLWTAAGKPQVDIDNPFTDVSEDAWYYDAVLWAVSEGITAGTSDTTFSPSKDCTRAQIVTFLWRAAGEPVVDYLMTFEDVASDAWYAEAVRWAVSEGITKGVSDTAFSPSMDCTRGQIVTFLYKAQAE